MIFQTYTHVNFEKLMKPKLKYIVSKFYLLLFFKKKLAFNTRSSKYFVFYFYLLG